VAGVSGVVALVGAAAVWAQGAWMAPADARNLKNPVNGVATAKRSIEAYCAMCHGAGGRGDGPQAASLPVRPADWTSEAVQRQTDGELFWKISNGRGAMPPWKQLSERERWELVNYIRALKK